MSFTIFDPDNPHRYDAILNGSPPKPENRRPMSLDNRAAQFAAFRALSGYEDMVAETARLTDGESELSDEMKEMLDRKLAIIREQVESGETPEVTLTYFIPDAYKNGGRYRTFVGKVKKIDGFNRRIVVRDQAESGDGVSVDIERIYDILIREDVVSKS